MPTNTNVVKITQTNLIGNGLVSPDPRAEVTDRGDPVEEMMYIFSIYGGASFSVDIVFQVEYFVMDVSVGIVNVNNVTCDFNFAAHGITATKLNAYTYRLAGTYTNAFANEYYNFVLKDKTLATLPANTDVDFIALVEYHMPNPTIQKNTYNFTVTAPKEYSVPTPTENIVSSMYQWVVWNYVPAVNNVKSLVNRGV